MAAPTSRDAVLTSFLTAEGWDGATSEPLAGDASVRRYHRLRHGAVTSVLMDAPLPREDLDRYIAIAALLRRYGASAPEIYAADRENGFLLIEDFGDDSYARLLGAGADEATLYALAVEALAAVHRAATADDLCWFPSYDDERLLGEAALLVDWYAPSVLGRELPSAAREEYLARWRATLPHAGLEQKTLVLRDYHPGNLMQLPGRPGVRACGLLDFQDAVQGPAAYDLVSLLDDARRDVSPALRTAMTDRYLAAFSQIDRPQFARSAAILSAQRNCKIIGLFVRLWRRDGKSAYLAHIPRVWRLVEERVRSEPTLGPIGDWLDRNLPPAMRRAPGPRSAAA